MASNGRQTRKRTLQTGRRQKDQPQPQYRGRYILPRPAALLTGPAHCVAARICAHESGTDRCVTAIFGSFVLVMRIAFIEAVIYLVWISPLA